MSKFRQRAIESPVKMAGNFNKVRQGAQPCKMPMVRGGARWSPDFIMEEVGCWSTHYTDAYGHGESKMEFHHCHGGGRLLVDLLDAHAFWFSNKQHYLSAHVQGGSKMEP